MDESTKSIDYVESKNGQSHKLIDPDGTTCFLVFGGKCFERTFSGRLGSNIGLSRVRLMLSVTARAPSVNLNHI
jgi:hypothetical protein